jgi:hypothetical protein
MSGQCGRRLELFEVLREDLAASVTGRQTSGGNGVIGSRPIAKSLESRAWESAQARPEEMPPDPTGSDSQPPPGMRWETDCDGKLIPPM